MRRNIPAISAILLFGILILCSACTGPGNEKPVIDVGLSQIPTQEISPYISFEEAKRGFEEYNNTHGSGGNFHVYYLISKNIDETGNAQSWLFGARQQNETLLLTYDRTGWSKNTWNAMLPSEEILLSQIIAPENLFIQNKGVIFSSKSSSIIESRNLVLQQGIYTLTINSGNTSRTLRFNATTGKMMSGNVS